MALLPPEWLDCVVALGVASSDEGEEPRWVATGFFYLLVEGRDGGRVQGKAYLVTARHVLREHASLLLRVNPSAAEPAKQFELHLREGGRADGAPRWVHPDDDELDVAVIPIDLAQLRERGMRAAAFHSDTDAVDRAAMVELEVSEGDDVFILGFPMGDVGGDRNYAIVRGGTIARVRDAMAGVSDHLVLDCFVFPGNSGGPVVLRAADGRPAKLLGLVQSYVPYRDVATSTQTGRARVVFEENTGLALAHPIDVVKELALAHARGGAAGSDGEPPRG